MGAMLNGQPRRTVRSRRSSSIIAQSIAILRAKGGSWWQPDPAYTFTGSDGTGAAGDNSDAGYGVDLCATYGPELIANGDFSNGLANWTNVQPGVTVQDAALRVVSAGEYQGTMQLGVLEIGSLYFVEADIVINSGSGGISIASGGNVVTRTTSGRLSGFLTATGTSIEIKRGVGAVDAFVDNVTVKKFTGRPLTQATTGFKPKLRRVPKRLGAELVVNGDFASGTGWTLGAGLTISDGALQVNASGGAATNSGPVVAGKSYAVAFDVTAYTSGSVRPFIGTVGGTAANTAGRSLSVVTATGAGIQLYVTSGSTALSVDNFSVREVLEWGWAWVFDGADDLLATVAQAAAASETLIVTKRLYALPASTRTAMAKAGTNTGVELYANSSVHNNSQIGTGTGYVYRSFSGTVATSVHSAVVTPTSRQIRVNGASSGVDAITFASAAATIKIGGGTAPFNGEIFAAAYCPTALSDAEMLIIERAMAQLGGITI